MTNWLTDDCSSGLHEYCSQCQCSCHGLQLDEREVRDLHEYFYKRAGFINYEEDLPLHKIIKRLDDYVKESEKQEIYLEKSKE